jgi:nucleoside-diphosphate-sugar epimerase
MTAAHSSSQVLVLGPVGRGATARLLRAGRSVTVAQRSRPGDRAPGATFKACDVCDPDAVLQASQGAGHIVLAVGFAYEAAI